MAVGFKFEKGLVGGDKSDWRLSFVSDCLFLGDGEFWVRILVGSCRAMRFEFGEKVKFSSIWLFMGLNMGEFIGSIKGLP